MALTPVVLALNASGFATAQKVAAALGAQLHGREGRVAQPDIFLPMLWIMRAIYSPLVCLLWGSVPVGF